MKKRIFKKKFEISSCYKFTDTQCEKPTLWLDDGVEEWLLRQFSGAVSCNHNLLHHGYHDIMGWRFHFNLNRYVYKHYGSWYEAYAPNKKLLRKNITGHISKIVQID